MFLSQHGFKIFFPLTIFKTVKHLAEPSQKTSARTKFLHKVKTKLKANRKFYIAIVTSAYDGNVYQSLNYLDFFPRVIFLRK